MLVLGLVEAAAGWAQAGSGKVTAVVCAVVGQACPDRDEPAAGERTAAQDPRA